MRKAKIILTGLAEGTFERPGNVIWTEQAPNDYELWRDVTLGMLLKMGIAGPEWTVGFFLDLLNSQDLRLRKALAAGIIYGQGLSLQEEEEGLVGTYVQRYEPFDEEQKSGLWTPGSP